MDEFWGGYILGVITTAIAVGHYFISVQQKQIVTIEEELRFYELSHHIKTQLGQILTRLQYQYHLCQKGYTPSWFAVVPFIYIYKSASSAYRSLCNLEILLSIKSGTISFEPTSISLQSVWEFVLVEYDLDILLMQPQITVKRLPQVIGDRGLLVHAFGELLDNSLRAKRVNAILKIDVIGRGNILFFRDDGIGIPESEIPHIFIPYYRGFVDTAGLGLAVSRAIFVLHNASLDVLPSSNGARFQVVFPS